MSISRLKPLNWAGDTIVEVLIVCAVLGMVLASGYAIAVSSLQAVQLTQERSYALKQAEGQLEMLKADFSKIPAATLADVNNGFCLDGSVPPTISPVAIAGGSPTDQQSNEDYTHYPAKCTQDPTGAGCNGYCYHFGVRPQANNNYLVSVRWDGPAGRPQQVQISYRLYQ